MHNDYVDLHGWADASTLTKVVSTQFKASSTLPTNSSFELFCFTQLIFTGEESLRTVGNWNR